jgi:hypothetical protein
MQRIPHLLGYISYIIGESVLRILVGYDPAVLGFKPHKSVCYRTRILDRQAGSVCCECIGLCGVRIELKTAPTVDNINIVTKQDLFLPVAESALTRIVGNMNRKQQSLSWLLSRFAL